ncbi:hypothetical protein NP233_g9983 [Leucocoprinus birnbaumii]|uniref:Uncharacterized protein n=1 Tax=Leucocoprinus birnbaumii TaxID=56174 RepID=A0AAD5YML5_9AGAR|nr:hypothetical protein NP233_g9983 [Leucocoprinus birnbaumii]
MDALHEWRKSVWQRDHRKSKCSAVLLLEDKQLEALTAANCPESLREMIDIVGEDWVWLGKYGGELLEKIHTLDYSEPLEQVTQAKTKGKGTKEAGKTKVQAQGSERLTVDPTPTGVISSQQTSMSTMSLSHIPLMHHQHPHPQPATYTAGLAHHYPTGVPGVYQPTPYFPPFYPIYPPHTIHPPYSPSPYFPQPSAPRDMLPTTGSAPQAIPSTPGPPSLYGSHPFPISNPPSSSPTPTYTLYPPPTPLRSPPPLTGSLDLLAFWLYDPERPQKRRRKDSGRWNFLKKQYFHVYTNRISKF